MAIQEPFKISGKAAADKQLVISDWKGGVNTFLDDGRLPKNTLRVATNIMLDQDGIPKPRWGTRNYGDPLGGVIDGDYKFTKYDAEKRIVREYNIAIADGKIYTGTDGRLWNAASEEMTLAPGYEASMLQIEDKVFIANGHDPLCYYDINKGTVNSFAAISTPGAPDVGRQGSLTAGDFKYYYKITAINNVGETAASLAGVVAVNKKREEWKNTVGETSVEEYVKVVWQAVDGAVRYNIYCSDVGGEECYIDSVAATEYDDTARTAINTAIIAPPDDTTTGPVMSVIDYSDNRIWGTGDPNNPYRVYFGGVAQNITAFSPFYGGGWIDIGKGGAEIPVTVRSYRDGKGDPINTVFMIGASGAGSQVQIELSSMTVGTTTFVVPMISKVIGSLGTSAANGVVEAKNNLFYPSTTSFNTTGSKADLLNVLSTDEISLAIRPEVRSINNQYSKLISAIFFDGKIFWSVPYGAPHNNEVWILDLDVKTWVRPWKLNVKKFFTFTDSLGKEHLLFRQSVGDTSYLIELSALYDTDNGIPFDFNLQSGAINFDSSHMAFWRVKKVYFEILRPLGNINLMVYGAMKNRQLQVLKRFKISGTNYGAGFNDDSFNSSQFDQAVGIPKIEKSAEVKKVLKIRKNLNNIKYEVSGNSTGRFVLSTLMIVGTPKRINDPSNWRK